MAEDHPEYRRVPLTASGLEELLADVASLLRDHEVLDAAPHGAVLGARVNEALAALLGVDDMVTAPAPVTGSGYWPDVVDLLDAMAEDVTVRAPHRAIVRQAAHDLRAGRDSALRHDTRPLVQRLRDRSRHAAGMAVARRMGGTSDRLEELADRATTWAQRRK